jgi:hypothetical protein
MALPPTPKPDLESTLVKIKDDIRALRAKVNQAATGATATKLINLSDVVWKVVHPTNAARDHAVPRWNKAKKIFQPGGGVVITKFFEATDESIEFTELLTDEDGTWPDDQSWLVSATAILYPGEAGFQTVYQEGNAGLRLFIDGQTVRLSGAMTVDIDGDTKVITMPGADDLTLEFEDDTVEVNVPVGDPIDLGLGRAVSPPQFTLALGEPITGPPVADAHIDYAVKQWDPQTGGEGSVSWLYEPGSTPGLIATMLLPDPDQAPDGYAIRVVVHMWPVP